MALSDRMEFGQICIKVDGVLEVRLDRVILDGEELVRIPKRFVYTPDMDPAALPNKVRQIANLIWTQAVVDAYKVAHPAGVPL